MCWDGKNLDSPDHRSHMAYPSSYNGGDCPDTHPVRIPGVFFEAFYSVSSFPHGNGTNPFVWSCGDPTGYGFHGDFLSGWDVEVMRATLADINCDNNNPAMAFGNNVKACPPLAPYVQSAPCALEEPIPLTEDLGISTPINALPGCNPLTYGPAMAVPCSAPPAATVGVDRRFLIKSVSAGKYLTAPNNQSVPISASVTTTLITLNEVFDRVTVNGSEVAILNEYSLQFLSVNGPNSRVMGNRGTASNWESFYFETHGSNIAIISARNGQYLSVGADGTIAPSATTVTNSELFTLEAPGGGSIGNPNFNTDVMLTRYTAQPIGALQNAAGRLAAFSLMILALLVTLSY